MVNGSVLSYNGQILLRNLTGSELNTLSCNILHQQQLRKNEYLEKSFFFFLRMANFKPVSLEVVCMYIAQGKDNLSLQLKEVQGWMKEYQT